MVFENFVTQHFAPHCREHLAAATAAGYEGAWRHLQGHLGQVELENLTVPYGIAAFAAISAENKQLSRRSLQYLRAVLSSMITHAIRLGFLPQNAGLLTRYIVLPKGGVYTAFPKAYTLKELKQILNAVSGPARVAVAIAGYAGLRQAEIQGLRWTDLRDDCLWISRSVWRGVVGETKNAASRAPVPVIEPLRLILDEWKQNVAEVRAIGSESFILASARGGSVRLDRVSATAIKPRLELIPLPWYGWHAFRRGLATTLMELGVQDKLISSILRHSNVATTMNIYEQARQDSKRAALESLVVI